MLEEIGCAMLILAYSVTCYLVGKGDLLTLIPTMLQDKLEQVTKERKERERNDREVVVVDDVDNLAKEMTEGKDAGKNI